MNDGQVPSNSENRNGHTISKQAVLDYIDRLLNQGTGRQKSFEFLQKFVSKSSPAQTGDMISKRD